MPRTRAPDLFVPGFRRDYSLIAANTFRLYARDRAQLVMVAYESGLAIPGST